LNIAMENCWFIDDLPLEKWRFAIATLNCPRVNKCTMDNCQKNNKRTNTPTYYIGRNGSMVSHGYAHP
jgi:hypothetical protein